MWLLNTCPKTYGFVACDTMFVLSRGGARKKNMEGGGNITYDDKQYQQKLIINNFIKFSLMINKKIYILQKLQ